MPRAPGVPDARPRRHERTTRGSRPTAWPSAARPRAGSGWARARRGPRGTAPRRSGVATDRTRRQPLGPGALDLETLTPDPGPDRRALAEHADVRPERRDGAAAAVHRHERARREAGHDHGAHVDRVAVGLEPGRELGDVLAGEVGHGVEHVRPGVEQEAAARHRRVLSPGPDRVGCASPARRGHRCCGCHRPRRSRSAAPPSGPAARGSPGRRRRAGGRSGRASRSAPTASAASMTMGFSSRTSRPASRQAVACAAWKTCGVMMTTASSVGRETLDEALPVGLVRRDVGAACGELGLGGCGDGRLGGLAQGDDVVSVRPSIVRMWWRAIAPAPMMPTRMGSVVVMRLTLSPSIGWPLIGNPTEPGSPRVVVSERDGRGYGPAAGAWGKRPRPAVGYFATWRLGPSSPARDRRTSRGGSRASPRRPFAARRGRP